MLDVALAEKTVNSQQGIAVPVTRRDLTFESLLSSARVVENALPEGSNWNGRDEPSTTETTEPVATSAQ